MSITLANPNDPTLVDTLFDYAALEPESRIVVRQKTSEIRERMARIADDIKAIGERLLVVKGHLEHGQWGAWLRDEAFIPDRTARRMMAVADKFKTANLADLKITPSAIALLASDTFTDDERVEAVAAARDGETITHAAVKAKADAKKKTAKPPQRHSSADAQPFAPDDDVQVEPDVESTADVDDAETAPAADIEPPAFVSPPPDIDSVEAAAQRRAHADASDDLLATSRAAKAESTPATKPVREFSPAKCRKAVALVDVIFTLTRQPFSQISTIDLRNQISELRDLVHAIAPVL